MHLLSSLKTCLKKKLVSFWLWNQAGTKPMEAGSIGKVPSLQGFRANLLI